MTKLSLAFVFVVAWGVTTLAQVQQPTVAGPSSAPRNGTSFFTPEILRMNYEADRVMLEHPSKPASMRVIRPHVRPVVETAKKRVTASRSRSLLGDLIAEPSAERSASKPISDVVPMPPGAE